MFDIPSLVDFNTKINSYLKNSILILSTIDGNLEYSTEMDKITKSEEYSFLYSYEQGLTYDKSDNLKQKLEKYHDYVLKLKKSMN